MPKTCSLKEQLCLPRARAATSRVRRLQPDRALVPCAPELPCSHLAHGHGLGKPQGTLSSSGPPGDGSRVQGGPCLPGTSPLSQDSAHGLCIPALVFADSRRQLLGHKSAPVHLHGNCTGPTLLAAPSPPPAPLCSPPPDLPSQSTHPPPSLNAIPGPCCTSPLKPLTCGGKPSCPPIHGAYLQASHLAVLCSSHQSFV